MILRTEEIFFIPLTFHRHIYQEGKHTSLCKKGKKDLFEKDKVEEIDGSRENRAKNVASRNISVKDSDCCVKMHQRVYPRTI